LKSYKLKIFCDFDGTVTKNDVWVSSLGRFINDRKSFDLLCEEFSSLIITARECIRKELDLVEDFSFEKFNSYLDKEELDDYLKDFLKYCQYNNFEVLSCDFPYSDEVCNWCGMSKRNVLINNTNDLENEISVYIGDGVSDFCVSYYADIVFAKKSLASHCWKNNITYFEYKTFKDIIDKLKKLIEQRKIKQRQTAKFYRRDVLLSG
jgi:2-hydroxy-3-keto-5-methylthiopentenyl-1-phosphate phosphatase